MVRFTMWYHRRQECTKMIRSFGKYFRDTHKATHHRKNSQYDQGYGHGCGAFVQMMLLFVCATEFAMKGEIEESEHIECREHCREYCNTVKHHTIWFIQVSTQQYG